jgi:sugar phosphate isomerase/epimerase
MIYTGLVSITFRKLKPSEIVHLVAQAGLNAIEWGGDVHVPHGDTQVAREVARMTADAGLRVAAYGSYFRVGHDQNRDAVVSTAQALGAPTIRVWAGKLGSADADAAYRALVVNESRHIADLVAAAGMTISYEFHGGTLTNTNASALALLREVDHPAVRTYWQPQVGMSVEACEAGLAAVLPWVTNVHVFHWLAGHERRVLSEGQADWLRYLRLLAGTGHDHDAMIEFVKDDDPEQFLADAATLQRWVLGVGRSSLSSTH